MTVYKKKSLDLHRKFGGKLSVSSKFKLNKEVMNLVYTPGVADVSSEIFKNKKSVWDYTIKKNTVAVVSDGSSVLGLGNIGPEASLPVMEGKAILFKEFAGIDAFPICLNTQDVNEIVSIVKGISPVFGGINLEDIGAPKCFEIEDKLQNIGIPVFHDDQHGTAIVVVAGLINACKVVEKKFSDLSVVINGAGAAGTAIAKMLICDGQKEGICESVKELIILDSKGAIYSGRKDLKGHKKELAKLTNKKKIKGKLEDCLEGVDVFIGVSRAGLLKGEMVKKMNKNSIVFALANPIPEIMPDEAKKAGAKIVATGRSDFPNQVNNVLVFPGIFRGALDVRAKKITQKMKAAAIKALAGSIKNPTATKILPSIFDKKIPNKIAEAVKKYA